MYVQNKMKISIQTVRSECAKKLRRPHNKHTEHRLSTSVLRFVTFPTKQVFSWFWHKNIQHKWATTLRIGYRRLEFGSTCASISLSLCVCVCVCGMWSTTALHLHAQQKQFSIDCCAYIHADTQTQIRHHRVHRWCLVQFSSVLAIR